MEPSRWRMAVVRATLLLPRALRERIFLVGAAKSLVTLRTWWAAGLEMTLAGIIVGGLTFLVGLSLPT